MSHAIPTSAIRLLSGSAHAPEAAGHRAQRASRLRERGMATVEYALGVVIVIVIIGIIITAISTGTFETLVKELIEAIMGCVQGAFQNGLSLGKR